MVGVIMVAIVRARNTFRKRCLSKELKKIPNFKSHIEIIGEDGKTAIGIDETNNKVCLLEYCGKPKIKIVDYKDIFSVEIIEDGITQTETSRGSQIAGAIIGGLALGGTGAIIGGLSGEKFTLNKVVRIDLRIVINDKKEPAFVINLLNKHFTVWAIEKNSSEYRESIKKARDSHSIISIIIKNADAASKTAERSIADELKKLAELRDSGIITLNEFNELKKRLLASAKHAPNDDFILSH